MGECPDDGRIPGELRSNFGERADARGLARIVGWAASDCSGAGDCWVVEVEEWASTSAVEIVEEIWLENYHEF